MGFRAKWERERERHRLGKRERRERDEKCPKNLRQVRYIRKSRAGINHLKESTVEIIPSLKICKSVAPQSIENRFIGPLVLL